ncbi:Uncharacterized protein conserved in bacteria [Bordetella ansorpii]|uniref:Uncharacterized protein conserved in bacteria n=1 Tax=Bordetella ansorpii TaxID=288768 RepID=A0A157SHH9_9BORD|nr:DUF2195 family protein [Bordetella ansorpii]SAI69887.1 Uncharacterized protein conserved in bacteria [Bordetella ansorpii]
MAVEHVMARLAGACLPALLALAPAASQAAGPVDVKNDLAQCVQVRPGLRSVENGLVLQQLTLQVGKSIGQCGCKSALASYRATVKLDGGTQSFTQSGVFPVMKSGTRMLPLASDPQVVGDRAMEVTLSCAPAD